MKLNVRAITIALAGTFLGSAARAAQPKGIQLTFLGTYATGLFNVSAAEIVAHDPATQRLFVGNAQGKRIDVLDITLPSVPAKIGQIDLSPYGAVVNSVAVHNGIIAVAVEASPKTSHGKVVLVDQALQVLAVLEVGSLPDMLTFSHNGRWLLVANEGEPNSYNNAQPTPPLLPIGPSVDPEGSVSIIDLSGGAANVTQADVRTAGFSGFALADLRAAGVRIYGPNATPAQDIEPEYITISQDSKTAWVTLQENNAIAAIDIESATVTQIAALGTKNHSVAGNGFDASDMDNAAGTGPAINIAQWPVHGMYLPDGIASYHVGGETFLVIGNEGDSRADWPGFNEEIRVGAAGYKLDPTVFPNASILKQNKKLGRLRVTIANGDVDNDGDYDEIWSYGGRSFSICDTAGNIIWDSGDDIEQITAAAYPTRFNASHDNNTFDARSPNKGPEPEGVAIGKAFGKTYAFIGLERIGGVMVYDISDPHAPSFVTYVNNRNFDAAVNTAAARDLGPEGVIFIKAEDSPNGSPLVVVANEISGTTTLFQVTKVK